MYICMFSIYIFIRLLIITLYSLYRLHIMVITLRISSNFVFPVSIRVHVGTYEIYSEIFYKCIRIFFTRTWSLGSCVKQHYIYIQCIFSRMFALEICIQFPMNTLIAKSCAMSTNKKVLPCVLSIIIIEGLNETFNLT